MKKSLRLKALLTLLEMFALTQSLPGVFAVNISIFVGYKLYKVAGHSDNLCLLLHLQE